ncbi:MAG: zeta toxin family protein [Paludibacteraceae bacterium]|nr:zeta toxin family protein [Paludibacteraceae bacterium]
MPHNLYIIAGCNGAGKTTASMVMLPEMLQCTEFVNADAIAKGLSPFKPEQMAVQAGRLMLMRIEELLERKADFSVETTLATRMYVHLTHRAQELGYKVHLLFFWLNSVDLAKKRVKQRVEEGGHNIDSDVIERRYAAGIKNLFELYLPICDTVTIMDRTSTPVVIATKKLGSDVKILDEGLWNKMMQSI